MPEYNKENEERPDPRFKARIAIFHGPYKGRLVSNYSLNLSTGGVFIETDNILPVDTSLTVKFKLPDNDTIINCKAKVAWTNMPKNLSELFIPPGMGLQFIDLSLEDLHAIRNYLYKADLIPIW